MYETAPLDRPRSYPYTVFNAEQCDGLPRRETPRDANSWNPIEEAERALARTEATIESSGENRACYDLRRDRIILPYRNQFPSGPVYYQTALHELGHCTGHPSRLNRPTLVQGIEEGFASPHYAREELRAAQDAQVMSDYVLDRTREQVPDREAEAPTGRERPALQPVRPAPEQPAYRRHFHREVTGPSR